MKVDFRWVGLVVLTESQLEVSIFSWCCFEQTEITFSEREGKGRDGRGADNIIP